MDIKISGEADGGESVGDSRSGSHLYICLMKSSGIKTGLSAVFSAFRADRRQSVREHDQTSALFSFNSGREIHQSFIIDRINYSAFFMIELDQTADDVKADQKN